ncbi:5'-methylthioadenosine/S-adenosylhomocysteine nucleosidase family protein [Nocardiopsis halophila]|uniref:5'-methylthioadenosine/S-adenosylhomocysteine nucleosidase family protein n=1 Tax=Nocardiopsis halophila TaxID=141692 RepID=UPI000344AB43|nr:hypothetical protein [Nocardiopsis halophila]
MKNDGKNSGTYNVEGIANFGGTNTMSNNAIGRGAVVNNGSVPMEVQAAESEDSYGQCWDIGVITILAEEARAVNDVLGLDWEPGRVGGLFFATGEVKVGDGSMSVVATRASAQGQRSAMGACENLRRHYDPEVLVMVGIGGGIGQGDDAPDIGDVVTGTRVVYYEPRKETAGGTIRRGEEREAPAVICHGVNTYFTVNGEPAPIPGQADGFEGREFQVFPSPIGSGEAVVAYEESEIRKYLTGFNDKILALDMEAGGLSQYWQENSVDPVRNPGWVVVRGISDRADREKGDAYHSLAARNAAYVARELIPYLR